MHAGTSNRIEGAKGFIHQQDGGIGSQGASQMLHRLEAAGFPPNHIEARIVHSHGSFLANHFSPLDDSSGARHAFWDAADRIINDAVLSSP